MHNRRWHATLRNHCFRCYDAEAEMNTGRVLVEVTADAFQIQVDAKLEIVSAENGVVRWKYSVSE